MLQEKTDTAVHDVSANAAAYVVSGSSSLGWLTDIAETMEATGSHCSLDWGTELAIYTCFWVSFYKVLDFQYILGTEAVAMVRFSFSHGHLDLVIS